ncbi:MAG: hypothetical protein R3F15_20585 [Lysobacterales bacterium]
MRHRHRPPVYRLLRDALQILVLCAAAVFGTAPALATQTVQVSTEQQLRDAIELANGLGPLGETVVIEVLNSLQLTELGQSGTATPVITGNVSVVGIGVGITLSGGGMGSDFRAFATAGGRFNLDNLTLQNFHSSGDGGCVAVTEGTLFGAFIGLSEGGTRVRFVMCHADGIGGAIFADDAEVALIDFRFEQCSAAFGGALALTGGATARVEHGVFVGNRASQDGGAIYTAGERKNPAVLVRGRVFRFCEFEDNRSERFGGSIDLRNGDNRIEYSRLRRGSAGVFGCYINNNAPADAPPNLYYGSQYLQSEDDPSGQLCGNTYLEIPSGDSWLAANTLHRVPDRADLPRLIDSTGQTMLAGNVLDSQSPATPQAKVNCADFGSGAFTSAGGNVGTDASCFLIDPSDQLVDSSPLLAPDADGVAALAPGSVAVERGASGVLLIDDGSGSARTLLPCGYRDIRGLGRPQDADGDGVYACDAGAWELQAGADLTLSHSGIYFDPLRSGEGYFVERIGGGAALVSTFTYGLNGGMAWFIGVGRIVGNSVVVDDMLGTRGGVFGPGLDETAIERYRVGSLSLVYSDCEATAVPGHHAFAAEPGAGFEDVATAAVRLASVVSCDGQSSPLAWRSGAWFPPGRSGEGLFVQYLPDGRAVLVYYGYTPAGEQFWAFAGDGVTIVGDVLTVPLLYPASTTRCGRNFDASEIDLQPFGTLTLTQTGCNTAQVVLAPTLDGYVGGSYDYVRLTQIEGTACPP